MGRQQTKFGINKTVSASKLESFSWNQNSEGTHHNEEITRINITYRRLLSIHSNKSLYIKELREIYCHSVQFQS